MIDDREATVSFSELFTPDLATDAGFGHQVGRHGINCDFKQLSVFMITCV